MFFFFEITLLDFLLAVKVPPGGMRTLQVIGGHACVLGNKAEKYNVLLAKLDITSGPQATPMRSDWDWLGKGCEYLVGTACVSEQDPFRRIFSESFFPFIFN